MQIVSNRLTSLLPEKTFSFSHSLWNNIQLFSHLSFWSDKFLDYQKDLIQDFFADFIDKIDQETYDISMVKKDFEKGLESLNTKLKLFADKVNDVDYFDIRWYIQLILDGVLISSMVWDTSILIFRDNKLYYQLNNALEKNSKIDLFADFIEWDTQQWDKILYTGMNLSTILDQDDVAEMQKVLIEDEILLEDFLDSLLASRIEKDRYWFIDIYFVFNHVANTIASSITKSSKLKMPKIGFDFKKIFLWNKYYIIVSILTILILFMLYGILWQILNDNKNTVVTGSGVMLDLTIDDIKKDIAQFQIMDVESDQKSIKYNEVLSKLELLENSGKWVEDVQKLREILENDYYNGFNIFLISDMMELDDPAVWTRTSIFSFNSAEKEKLGELKSLDYSSNLLVWASQWALLWVMNDGIRGTLVQYTADDEIKSCSPNLLSNWLYCVTDSAYLYSVTKEWFEPLITQDGAFPDTILEAQAYWKVSMYVFQPNLSSSLPWVMVTKYRSNAWSQTSFQGWENYSLIETSVTWWMFGEDFANFAIDSTFFTWSNGKLYQLWRPWYSPKLELRNVDLIWWDTISSAYSDNVYVHTSIGSRYVYLFDKDNQTFTVYDSNPIKTNDAYAKEFSLRYLFRFKFDLSDQNIIDVVIPEETWSKPELYLLTEKWIYKVNLYDFINSVKKQDS